METRSIMVKYDVDTIKVLIHRILNGNDEITKSKLIEMLSYISYEYENFSKKVVELSIGAYVPDIIPVGTTVKVNPEKTGWLSTDDREVLNANTKDKFAYGTVMSFKGYHSYSNYQVAFKEKIIDLPMDCLTSFEI